jgi:hypothetical protein
MPKETIRELAHDCGIGILGFTSAGLLHADIEQVRDGDVSQ